MNFGAQPPLWSVPARELLTDFRIDHFFWGAGTVLVCTHDGAVDEDVFKGGLIVQSLEKPFPYAASTPPVEALVDGMPAAEFLGQNPPVNSRTGQPQDRFHKQPIVAPGPSRVRRLARQMRRYPFPNRVIQFLSVHPC